MNRAFFSVVLLFAACTGDVARVIGAGSDHRFVPDRITVDVEDSVSFSNGSSEAHTFTGDEDSWPGGVDYLSSGGFASEAEARADLTDGLVSPGENFEIEGLDQPGTYRFFCIPHEADGMTMTIVVR